MVEKLYLKVVYEKRNNSQPMDKCEKYIGGYRNESFFITYEF